MYVEQWQVLLQCTPKNKTALVQCGHLLLFVGTYLLANLGTILCRKLATTSLSVTAVTTLLAI